MIRVERCTKLCCQAYEDEKRRLGLRRGHFYCWKPEMLEPKLKVAVDYGKCHPEQCGRGSCAAAAECPLHLWKQEAPYDLPFATTGFCQDCGICVEACPLKAVRML